jgi:beta-N-acetylhexosaminidase
VRARALPLLAAGVALALGACGGGSSPSVPIAPLTTSTAATTAAKPRPSRPASAVDRLSLRQQVGQTLVLAFGGTQAPRYVLRALREGRVAGVILFGGNIADPPQVRALTASLRRASGRGALVMTDQEGGPFHILPWAAPSIGEAEQATPAQASGQARAAARDLRAVGVNVNLAPVADVGRPGSALAARTFPGGPRPVASSVAAAVRAYRAGGVGATAKHFPGLGAATSNTDDAQASVRLAAADLEPFKAAIAAGVPLIMASHALYPNVDGRNPASQSPALLRDLLRGRLGFRGAVITDSMEAEAVTSRSSVETASQRALLAGADLVLMTGDGSFRPVSLSVLARARRDRVFRARVRTAAGRVLALKRFLGLSPPAGR